jgi:hypothetical protein
VKDIKARDSRSAAGLLQSQRGRCRSPGKFVKSDIYHGRVTVNRRPICDSGSSQDQRTLFQNNRLLTPLRFCTSH